MKSLALTHATATRKRLLLLAEEIPGAWIGIKIAALLLLLEGQRTGWINQFFELNRTSLMRWVHRVNKEGIEAIKEKFRPGRPGQLTVSVRRQIEVHLEKSPQEFGWGRVQWDGPTLNTHLKRLGADLKVRQAQRLLHHLGYRLKRASHVYLKAKAEDAKRFGRHLKKLRTLKKREPIVFQDETGFTLHPRLSRGWAKIGQRLKICTTSQHRDRLNVFGWVAPLLGRQGIVKTPSGNRQGFLSVLKHLCAQLKGYKIWLYVDNAGWHKGDAIKLFIREHHQLHLEYLPPYQPALNMQERVWRRLRYEATTNHWFKELDDVWSSIRSVTRKWPKEKIKRLCCIT